MKWLEADELEKDIVGQGITGSTMYHLNHEDSDIDWLRVVSYPTSTKSTVTLDEDVTIMNVNRFVSLITTKAPIDLVDILNSRSFVWNRRHEYHPLVMSVQYNRYLYLDHLRAMAKSTVEEIKKSDSKAEKRMRLVVRYLMSQSRSLKWGVEVTEFHPIEREYLFRLAKELLRVNLSAFETDYFLDRVSEDIQISGTLDKVPQSWYSNTHQAT